jgi:glutamyl-tRNA synthetase
VRVEEVRDALLDSLGLPAGPLERALAVFDPAALPREPWVWPGMWSGRAGSPDA